MKIFKIALVLIILASAILIGSPVSYNCKILSLVIVLVGIIFGIYNFFIKKEKIIDNKLDCCLLALCLTPLIPLIFNTYISLTDTITSLLKYISCFVIYILVKKIIGADEKNKNIIINTLIVSSIFLSVIGIDEMTTKYFLNILEKLNLPYVINIEHRMFSSLGYANSFAIIMAVSVLLILERINNRENKKYELIYSGALFISLSCLLLTYSRAVFCLLVLALIAYILINKDKKKTIYTIYILGLNFIFSLIYVTIYTKFNVWLITILMFAISCAFLKILDKLYEKLEKVSNKFYIILIIITIIVVILAIFFGIKLTRPLTIFEANTGNDEVRYSIDGIENNKEYILKFDINSKATVKNIQNYTIVVEEENKYYDTVASHEISFSNFNGIKEIKFTTTDETIRLTVYFKSRLKIAQQGLTINTFTVNGEEHPLNYLYLPVSIVDKIKSINFENKSVWERGTYYTDSIKIIKDNWLAGLGANAWKYKYIEVQSYDYSATEVHSYPIQLILEYGILALLIFIIAIIIIFINFVKSIKNGKNIALYIALFLLIAHSAVDFDMSFFYIMVILFILIGLTTKSLGEPNSSKTKIVFVLLSFIFIFTEVIGIFNIINIKKLQTRIDDLYLNLYNQNYNELISDIKKIRKTEKSDLYLYILSDINYIDVSEENLQYLYDEVIKLPITANVEYDMQKNRMIEQIVVTSENEKMTKKFADIIIDQNEQICDIIKNRDINRLTVKEQERYLSEQEHILNYIQNM